MKKGDGAKSVVGGGASVSFGVGSGPVVGLVDEVTKADWAVIFDMDGTLVDTEPYLEKTEREIYKELGIEVGREEHLSLVGTTAMKFWGTLIERYGLDVDPLELVLKCRTRVIERIQADPSFGLIPGAEELLLKLRAEGVRLALASSASEERVKFIIDLLDLERFFEFWIAGDQVENGKPAPDLFLRASEELCVPPERCIVVEDALNGVRAAHAAGMKCVGFGRAEGRQDLSLADLVVKSYEELSVGKLRGLLG